MDLVGVGQQGLEASVSRGAAIAFVAGTEICLSSKKKKDQLALAQYGYDYSARPDPDDPGGLGAEESGTERTGPTQSLLLAT
jgi:hypothetical protein